MTTSDLRSDRWLYPNLFHVDGELVEYYNRALEKVIGKRTELTSFYVDRRGKSPEIMRELGDRYLETTPSNRYMISITPEQEHCDLVDAEFTFDEEAISEIYAKHRSGVSVVTRVDGLYGELHDGIKTYDTVDDILSIRSIDIRLHTPSGFITTARELRSKLEELEKNPKLLLEQDGTHVKRMIELVNQVGDIRGYPITDISVTHEVHSFASSLYGGIFSYTLGGRQPVRLKRPGRDALGRFQGNNENGGQHTVIFDSKHIQHGDREDMTYISIHDTDAVASFLLDKKLAIIDPALIDTRLRRLEDLAVIASGNSPVHMSREERQRAVYALESTDLRDDLLTLRAADRNDKLMEAAADVSPSAIISILAPYKGTDETNHVTKHLLCTLQPHNYEDACQVVPGALERSFTTSNGPTREYIISTLKNTLSQR